MHMLSGYIYIVINNNNNYYYERKYNVYYTMCCIISVYTLYRLIISKYYNLFNIILFFYELIAVEDDIFEKKLYSSQFLIAVILNVL